MAHEDEAEAFRDFLSVFPEHSTLLVDTYDVRAAVEKIIALGRKPGGVRLDSGDVLTDSLWVRRRLDQAGWHDAQIFASGELDEDRLETLVQSGARRLEAPEKDPLAGIERARKRFLADRSGLPEPVLALRAAEPPFPVRYSKQLEELHDQVRQTVAKTARIA